MKIANSPTVSIGMPIYNAEASLRTALDALLRQDYSDFELVINDNCSTDSTWEICREYAAHDSRIRLYRNSENIGGIANFNKVFERCTGKYFMWAAHDDYWEPTFIRACVEQLEANPDAVLCYVRYIMRYLETQRETLLSTDLQELHSLHPWKRIHTLLTCYPFPYSIIYGVFRQEALAEALPLQSTLGSDGLLLLRAARIGPFLEVNQPLFITTKGATNLKARARSFNQKASLFTILKWDFNLLWFPMRIAQSVAPGLRERWILFTAGLRYTFHYTGWPSPRRIFNRYSRFVFSDRFIDKLALQYRQIRGNKTNTHDNEIIIL